MNNKNKKSSQIVINVICVIISICCLYPVFWLFMSALKSNNEFILHPLALPRHLELSNFPEAMRIANIFNAMKNSSIYVVIVTILVNIGAFVTAYFISRSNFRGKKFIIGTYFIGMLIPMYSLMVPVFIQFKALGMLNSRLTLCLIYTSMHMSLSIFLYNSFIDSLPKELDDAALIDGCTTWQTLFDVTFPLCRPIASTVSILTVIGVWNEFGFAMVITPRKVLRPVAVAVQSFNFNNEVIYSLLFAGLAVVTVPILVVYLIFSKQIINGMTAGSVKG
jgi:raffinose/stachyose/melibiose transport system permease protein